MRRQRQIPRQTGLTAAPWTRVVERDRIVAREEPGASVVPDHGPVRVVERPCEFHQRRRRHRPHCVRLGLDAVPAGVECSQHLLELGIRLTCFGAQGILTFFGTVLMVA
jgi:hypothetical protein